MRALGAIGGLVALLGTTASFAADLDIQGGGGYYNQPIGQVVIWDVEPGIVTRSYWATPWQNRRYFPSNGEAPEVGRDEDLSQRRPLPPPAPSYRRYWSTSSAFTTEYPQQQRGAYYVEQELPEPSLK